eukprot:jgi/Tetstr1/460255/TSEL_005556.t1
MPPATSATAPPDAPLMLATAPMMTTPATSVPTARPTPPPAMGSCLIGVCGGGATAVGLAGECCLGALDAEGRCCPAAQAKLDDCGVCGGGNACSAKASVEPISSLLAEVDFTVQPAASQQAGGGRGGAALLRRRRSRAACRRGDPQLVGDWTGGLLASLRAVTPVLRAGTCGNHVCEAAEACRLTHTGAAPAGGGEPCCAEDCPQPIRACPSAISAQACSGHGTCDPGSGVCTCFAGHGFSGSGCSFWEGTVLDAGAACLPAGTPPSPTPMTSPITGPSSDPKFSLLVVAIGCSIAAALLIAAVGLSVRFIRRRRRWARTFPEDAVYDRILSPGAPAGSGRRNEGDGTPRGSGCTATWATDAFLWHAEWCACPLSAL